MIVKLVYSEVYQRLIDCDTLHIHRGEKGLELDLYNNGKHIEGSAFKDDPVSVYVMENGKTIETISFTPPGNIELNK